MQLFQSIRYCASVRACRVFFFFSSRRRHTRLQGDWSSDVCSSDLPFGLELEELIAQHCCELEVELLCGGLHLLFEQPDERLPLARVRRAAERREIGRASCRERV